MAAPMYSRTGGSPERKGKFVKKRKQIHVPTSDNMVKLKQRKLSAFTEIEFKVLLRDQGEIISGFEQFLEAAEKFCDDSDNYDIVGGWCRSSPECTEILHVLETGKWKVQEYQLIFACLEKILLRIADDLQEYHAAGQTVVKKLLSVQFKDILFMLNMANKSSQIKSAIKLLISMAMLGPISANLVLTHVEFGKLKHHFNRRDSKDDEDVRTCMLHLVVAILLSGSEAVRRLADTRGLFESVFNGMVFDQVSTVQLMLSTVLDKVVLNPVISKTSKVRVFTESALTQLALLFQWMGPSQWKSGFKGKGWKDGGKRKQEPDSTGINQVDAAGDVDEEERSAVAELVHRFLTEVCSSYKHGIVFMDKSYGLTSKNQNHLLTSFLSKLVPMSQNTLVQELVCKVLCACPDQIRHFFVYMVNRLSPDMKSSWFANVQLLCKIYEALPSEPYILRMNDRDMTIDVLKVLLIYTLPPPTVFNLLMTGLKNKSLAVNYVTLSIVKLVAQKSGHILSTLRSGILLGVYTQEEITDITSSYREAVLKSLPDAVAIFQCWDKTHALQSGKDLTQLQQLHNMCQVGMSEVWVRLEQVLCLYQALTPSLLVDHPVGLGKLLDGIVSLEVVDGDTATAHLPQIYLLKLLAGTDARRLPWNKQNSAGHSLLYQLLEMVAQACRNLPIREITLNLICKLFESTGWFESCYDELMTWMRPLQNYPHRSPASDAVLGFVAKTLNTYMNNPFPYMDRVCDLMSEVVVTDTRQEHGSSTSSSDKINAILSMDLSDVEEEEAQPVDTVPHKRFPFCPMLLVAMDTLQSADSIKPELQEYLSSVVLSTFHMQTNPAPFCHMISGYHGDKLTNGLHDYILIWMPRKQASSSSVSVPPVAAADGSVYTEWMYRKLSGHTADDIQRYLLHLTFLLDHQPNVVNKSIPKLLKSVIKVLRETATLQAAEMDIDGDDGTENGITSALDEVALLDVDKKSKEDMMAANIKLILNHYKIRNHFYQIDTADQSTVRGLRAIRGSLSRCITDLVVHLLDQVRQCHLDMGDSVQFYHAKILQSIASCMQDTSEGIFENSQWKALRCIAGRLTAEECVGFLEKVDCGGEDLREEPIFVIDDIIETLTNSNIRHFMLSKRCMQEIMKYYSHCNRIYSREIEDNNILPFFTKFPSLTTLCSERSFLSMMNNDRFVKVADVMIRHSVGLHTKFGEMVAAGESMDICGVFSKDQYLLMVVTYLECLKLTKDMTKPGPVLESIVKIYQKDLKELCGPQDPDGSQEVLELAQQLASHGALKKKLVKEMTKTLMATITSQSSVRVCHVELCRLVMKENRTLLLQTGIQALTKVLSCREYLITNVAVALLDILATFSKEEMAGLPETWSQLPAVWPKFVKNSLKHYYEDSRLLHFLTKLLPAMYQDDSVDMSISVDTIIVMVMSHSSFLKCMFNESKTECKEALLDLLTELVGLCPKACHSDHVGIFLGAYGASLTLADQKILNLLQVYEKNGVEFASLRPFLWGEKAIEHHSLRRSMGQSLLKQATMKDVLANIDPATIQRTILHFPVRRRIQSMEPQTADKFKSRADCYDPCFLLPLFSQLLAPDAVVNCKQFVERDCLGLVLASLSSHDEAMRGASYHILDRFRVHLDGTRFREKLEVIYLMDLVHNSLPNSKQKLACIISIFLARVVKLMLRPADHMYGVINKFLHIKPTLDVQNIPEFYKLFNSSSMKHKSERNWILSLMHDGMRETSDYRVYERKYAFKLIMSFYGSDVADRDSKLKIVQILHAACQERTVALGLCTHHGLIVWIAAAISKRTPENSEHVSAMVALVHSLWISIVGREEYSKTDNADKMRATVIGQILAILQSLLWCMRDVSTDCLLQHLRTLTSVLHHARLLMSQFHRQDRQLIIPTVSIVDVLLLLVHADRCLPPGGTSSLMLTTLASLGYNTHSLVQDKRCGTSRGRWQESVSDHDTVVEDGDTAGEMDDGDAAGRRRAGKKVVGADGVAEAEGSRLASGKVIDSDTDDVSGEARQKELRETLVKVFVEWQSCHSGAMTQEVVATQLMLMAWLVRQIEAGISVGTVEMALLWMEQRVAESCSTVDAVLVRMLGGTADMSQYIISGLIRAYTIAFNWKATGTATGEEETERASAAAIVGHLNNILMAVAVKKFGMTEGQIEAKCQGQQADADTKPLLLSVELRRLFHTKGHATPAQISSKVKKVLKRKHGSVGSGSVGGKKVKVELEADDMDMSESTGLTELRRLSLTGGVKQDSSDSDMDEDGMDGGSTPSGDARKQQVARITVKQEHTKPVKKTLKQWR